MFVDAYDGAFLDITMENMHPTKDSRESFRMVQSEEIALLAFLKAREIQRLRYEADKMNAMFDAHTEAIQMNANIDRHERLAKMHLQYAKDEMAVRSQHAKKARELKTGKIQS